MSRLSITVAVNDEAREPLEAEHGLSLILRFLTPTRGFFRTDSTTEKIDWKRSCERLYLFDTGAGRTTLPNLNRLGVEESTLSGVFLSHGHYDHTGGIAALLSSGATPELWYAPGVDCHRYKIDPFDGAREISIPSLCRDALNAVAPMRRHVIGRFTEITPNIALTGPIGRQSFETTGGAFFLDAQGKNPDTIADEQSLIWRLGAGGVSDGDLLITGCCHAGIINTLEHCRRHARTIHTVLGGLHLNSAPNERLERTLDYLNRSSVRRLILLHCTGGDAANYFRQGFRGETVTAVCGDTFDFT